MPSEESDKPVHPHNLVKAFPDHPNSSLGPKLFQAETEQTPLMTMCRLI